MKIEYINELKLIYIDILNGFSEEEFNKEKIYLPLSELESQTTASIPFHENLTTEDINYIIESIYEYNTK